MHKYKGKYYFVYAQLDRDDYIHNLEDVSLGMTAAEYKQTAEGFLAGLVMLGPYTDGGWRYWAEEVIK